MAVAGRVVRGVTVAVGGAGVGVSAGRVGVTTAVAWVTSTSGVIAA